MAEGVVARSEDVGEGAMTAAEAGNPIPADMPCTISCNANPSYCIPDARREIHPIGHEITYVSYRFSKIASIRQVMLEM